jgi:hypothetical protein
VALPDPVCTPVSPEPAKPVIDWGSGGSVEALAAALLGLAPAERAKLAAMLLKESTSGIEGRR